MCGPTVRIRDCQITVFENLFVPCLATDNAASMLLSGLCATGAWVATDGAISYDASPDASTIGYRDEDDSTHSSELMDLRLSADRLALAARLLGVGLWSFHSISGRLRAGLPAVAMALRWRNPIGC